MWGNEKHGMVVWAKPQSAYSVRIACEEAFWKVLGSEVG